MSAQSTLVRLLEDMNFGERLVRVRKTKGMTQQGLADATGIHVTQVRRYEGGKSQPTLEILRKLATGLSVTSDELLFDETERSPSEDLRLQFEAASRLPDEDRKVVKSVIEGILLKHEAKRWAASG